MNIDFEKSPDGLVPAIIQDAQTKNVLMLGYMNREAFEKTQTESRVTFFSRSRQRLWTKGETSGNFLHVKEIFADCDNDTILIRAIPIGPICHTGADTCFNRENIADDFLSELEKIIQQRKLNPQENSYTTKLFREGINKISQKVGEEAIELIIEAKDNNDKLFKNETADLIYHLLVLLAEKNSSLNDIVEILRERHQGK
jgi:phosphoribosyl-ATP pyrophosphohydrolase/phosphoribosyl-AMP cyclohydrolase